MRGARLCQHQSLKHPAMTKHPDTATTIGILGGGQLGRMLCIAAARLGIDCHVFEPAPAPPAAAVAARLWTAGYDDIAALTEFAGSVDVVTFEFENIPTSALDLLEQHVAIHPSRTALGISQDRISEKDFLTSLGLRTAPYSAVGDSEDMAIAIDRIGVPAILKTRRFGYDGKGQVRIQTAHDGAQALAELAGAPAVLEGFVDFDREISVIAARNVAGQVSCFDPGENVHKDGILRTTTVPAQISASQRTDAILIAAKILNALDYVGVIGVELFVTPAGLIVNEIAPRVHNSGHWTQNGCAVDQFEQHIRAVAGWPLGDGQRFVNIEMENLIGTELHTVPDHATAGQVAIHLYGKKDVKPGRKMGHINRITGPTIKA